MPKLLVTQRKFGGMLRNGWGVADGLLWNEQGELVPTLEEEDFFRANGVKWIEPEQRGVKSGSFAG